MPEKWTGLAVGRMHVNCITLEDLGHEMGCTRSYVSMLLNSVRKPPNAKERVNAAIDNIIARRKEEKKEG